MFRVALLALAFSGLDEPPKPTDLERATVADKQAMALFRDGKAAEGRKLLLKAAPGVGEQLVAQTPPDEALVWAKIYVRLYATGRPVEDRVAMNASMNLAFDYAVRGGVERDRVAKWVGDVTDETMRAVLEGERKNPE